MKRLFAFLLCFILALPALTGCGAAQGDAAPRDNVPAEATPAEITPTALPPTPAATAVPTLAEGSHGADEAPFVRAGSWFPEDAAPETPRDPALGYITSYECAQSEDERIGCFYIEPARLEAIRALPQDEKRIFNLVPLPGYAYDARYAHVLEALEANRSAMSIYYKAMAGELPAEDYSTLTPTIIRWRSLAGTGMISTSSRGSGSSCTKRDRRSCAWIPRIRRSLQAPLRLNTTRRRQRRSARPGQTCRCGK